MQILDDLLNKNTILAIILAGIAGELAFELYAMFISPLIFGVSLQPAKLVAAIAAKLTGVTLPHAVAFLMHFTVGVAGFGTLVYLVRRIVSTNPWISGGVTGLFLWFLAQGVLAPFVGRSFMMGFGSYTQSSFVGHVGMTLVVAHILHLRLRD